MGSVQLLRTVMRVQAIVFLIYGAAWILFPDFALGTLFDYEVDSLWPRVAGGAFLGVAWLEWNVVEKLDDRLDLVWPFALIPGLYVVILLWERMTETYPGTDSFWWVSLAVTLVFFVAVIASRPSKAPASNG